MIRINLILFLLLIGMSLALVTSQYQVRLLKTELEQQLKTKMKFATQYGQLQLEQSTYAMHSKLEKHAKQKLKMSVPEIKKIQVIDLEGN